MHLQRARKSRAASSRATGNPISRVALALVCFNQYSQTVNSQISQFFADNNFNRNKGQGSEKPPAPESGDKQREEGSAAAPPSRRAQQQQPKNALAASRNQNKFAAFLYLN